MQKGMEFIQSKIVWERTGNSIISDEQQERLDGLSDSATH